MSESQNVQIVQQIYDALLDDDIPRFLQLLASDVEWEYPAAYDIPYGGIWRGHEGVVRFSEAHDEIEEIVEFSVSDHIAQGDHVAVRGLFRGRDKPTGRVWETRFVHVVTVRNGKVQRFEAYFDTAAAARAHRT